MPDKMVGFDPYSKETIAEITARQEAEAEATYALAEKLGGTLPQSTGKTSTIFEEEKQSFNEIQGVKNSHTGSDGPPSPIIMKETDVKKRWDNFAEMKGITERTVKEKKEKTGVGVEVPTQEEVKKINENKKMLSGSLVELLKTKNEKKAILVSPSLEKDEKVVKQKKKSKSTTQKVMESVKVLTRKEIFEQNPKRTDWVYSDIVEVRGMHPNLLRAYIDWFKEIRRRKSDITYEEAKLSLLRMGHPMRFLRRSRERRYYAGA